MAGLDSTPTFDTAMHARRIDEDGFTIIPDFLDAADLAEVRRVLGFYLGSHAGRNDFEGTRTERVYTLVARGRVFWRIALDPRVLGLCDRFLRGGYLLTASQAIRIAPGETPQPFHSDDAFYHLPRPRPMISLSTIVAVDEFTAENGATEIVPGSHRWDDRQLAHSFDTDGLDGPELARVEATFERLARPVIMPAGGCIVFAGTLLHRGGRHRGDRPRGAFSHQYCEPWARQQEELRARHPVRRRARDAAAPAGDARLLDPPAVHRPAEREPPAEGARADARGAGGRAGARGRRQVAG
jgi:ectoine hydroxylase-related dioxygenase (phytanoyl-CoA dioxygenase family)